MSTPPEPAQPLQAVAPGAVPAASLGTGRGLTYEWEKDMANVLNRVSVLETASRSGQWFITDYGAVVDGLTDDSAAVQAAISAAAAGGGGTVVFPAGITRINSQIVLPTDAASPVPGQVPLTLAGAGSRWDGTWQAQADPPGASILDLRYVGTDAKIETHGRGILSIRDLVLTDLGISSNPLLHTTNTTLAITRTTFAGNPTKTGTGCDQDAVVLGGTTTTVDGSTGAAFQGYGSVITGNYFMRVRRGVWLRTYANALVITNNTWSTTCGADASAAAIDFSPLAGQYCAGALVSGNLVEAPNYVYAVHADYTSNCCFIANNIYDEGASFLAAYRFDDHGFYNLVIDGIRNDIHPLVSESAGSAATNTQLSAHQSQTSVFTQPVAFSSLTPSTFTGVKFTGGNAQTLVQPATDQSESAVLLRVLRSAADDTHPGGVIFEFAQNGSIASYDSTGNEVIHQLGTWWAPGTGRAFSINTGTGGSYLNVQAYALRLQHYTSGVELVRLGISPQSASQGALQFAGGVVVTSGAGSPEGVVTAPPGSLYTNSTGGAGTTLYVKESGTAATGWVAK